ncbi:MAG: hypothetical protein PWP54_1269 [Thermosipho sp. (in: thermotogales)]|jgi:prepilin-type N-terminal cleavage/methylation domain-containing protein|nr:hypothetical protein [Thermosipho sp. (in: thermotogales)]MDN5324435.1 hypothetical protein [Thermosipho sp. (in: thermotogales)]
MIKNSKSGFSLVEVLTVLIIMAIIFGLVYGMFTVVYIKLSNQAKLNNSIQRVFYLFVSTRREAFLKDQVMCIKYENKKFSSFVDNNLDGVSDNGNEVIVEIPDQIDVYIDNLIVNNINIYSRDGMFLKLSKGAFTFDYSNMEIKLQLNEEYKIMKVTNSLPEILE